MKTIKFKSASIAALVAASLASCTSFPPIQASSAGKPVIVIDPGHGTGHGTGNIDPLDGSSANNAEFYSAKLKRTIKERELTLEVAKQVADFVNQSGKAKAILTKTGPENIGMKARADVAIRNRADAFVSIHFNSGRSAHGPVAIVQGLDYTKKPVNTKDQLKRDKAFGDALAKTVASVTSGKDSKSVAKHSQIFDRKDEGSWLFRYLRESDVGKSMNACFLEIEFMDNPAVAAWLLERDDSKAIRTEIARAIANHLVETRSNR